MSREQTVRDVAYAIWEAEGKPMGRELDHWQQAESRVAASVKSVAAKAKAPAKGKVLAGSGEMPAAKPPAKIAAPKAAPAKAAPKKKG